MCAAKYNWSNEDHDDELTPQEMALRDAFVREYLKDYHATKAAIRLGYKSGIAGEYAARFMNEPYVLRRIADTESNNGNVLDSIKSGLLREAHFNGPGSSHGARVSAYTQLSRIEGMDKSATPVTNINQVMVHLTKEQIAMLSDNELDTLINAFQKMNITLATMPEAV
jgi:hypothetical protein